jgi:hypothetical protein
MLTQIEPRFVAHVPRALDPGVLYISMEFATAVHACCCGCGEEVVTPFTPKDWSLTYDGESVSLWPSIGNWNMACRSHYVLRQNKVVWLRGWSRSDIHKLVHQDGHPAKSINRKPWWSRVLRTQDQPPEK